MFYDGLFDLWRIILVGTLSYAGLVALLRATGKRTLSKMNAFDFVVTVALGSTLASALLTNQVSLSEALTAFALLCFLQYAVAWLSVRSLRFQRLIKAEPSLLVFRGRMLPDRMRSERVAEAEILAALREQGVQKLEDAHAVVLETDGSFSVVADGPADVLGNVNRPAEAQEER